MEIQQYNNDSKGFFSAKDGGREIGRMTYSIAGSDIIIIDHTEVDAEYKGKSAGKQMLMAAVDYAREHKVKIIPLCPFAKSVFDRISEIRDVL